MGNQLFYWPSDYRLLGWVINQQTHKSSTASTGRYALRWKFVNEFTPLNINQGSSSLSHSFVGFYYPLSEYQDVYNMVVFSKHKCDVENSSALREDFTSCRRLLVSSSSACEVKDICIFMYSGIFWRGFQVFVCSHWANEDVFDHVTSGWLI